MHRLPIQRKSLPEEELGKLGVTTVYLFGSHAENVARQNSDIDVAILFKDPLLTQSALNQRYQALYEIFTDAFDMSGFRDIDIVFLERVPLELRFDVISHGKILFEKDTEARLAFEERTNALYRDFKPLLDASNEAVLQRI